jgi:acyl-CoA dehydrogenase
MADRSFLAWPFFDDRHRSIAEQVEEWAGRALERHAAEDDPATMCTALVRAMGDAGLLGHVVAAGKQRLDVRSLCIIRETLARHSGLADFAFAMQGLGSGPVSLFGSEAQQSEYPTKAASGSDTKTSSHGLSRPTGTTACSPWTPSERPSSRSTSSRSEL